MLLNEASPTTVKSPPMDKSLLTNKRLFILTSKRKLLPEEVDATSPKIADAGIEASGKLRVPVAVRSVTDKAFIFVFPETFNVAKIVVPVIVALSPVNVLPVMSPVVVIVPLPGNARLPSLSNVIFSVPAVKNDNVSLSEVVSALIYVS